MSNPDDITTPPVETVPVRTIEYDTYQRVVSAKTNLEAQVGALKAERDSALERAATVDSVIQERDSWQSKATAAATRFDRFQAIASTTGNTGSEAMDLVEYAYERVPLEGRPDLADWLNGFKADPSSAPLALRSVFGQVAPAGATTQPRPNASVPSSSPPGGGVEFSSEKVQAVRERAQSTGDWSEYEGLRQRMGIV